MESHAPRQSIVHLLGSLHHKFGSNIKSLTPESVAILERFDLNSRAIDGIRSELLIRHCGEDKQKIECAQNLTEIFADFSLAMYFLATGLIVPARMLVRRGLELGVAIIYMWDIPHEFWGWTKHDEDLSFSNMIVHLSSDRYLTHLANVQGKVTCENACNPAHLKRLYRDLSNTVHGKLDGLPPLSPDRYSSDKNRIEDHLTIAVDVQRALIDVWCSRFPDLRAYLENTFPQTVRRTAK